MGEVCPNVGVSRRSEEFFINGGGVRVVWSVSGRNRRFRRFYWDEYAILEKFPELLEIKIPIAVDFDPSLADGIIMGHYVELSAGYLSGTLN